jgi:membrane-associated phospholipid phosphatase
MNSTVARAVSDAYSSRHDVARRVANCVVLPALFLYAALVGSGLLISHVLGGLIAGEDEINRDLAEHRTPTWSTVTSIVSTAANTPIVIGTVLVFAIALRLIYRGWRQAATLVTAVLLQAAVFLLTTLVVDRPRPKVPPLDEAPPTSSFPSGHTGAATALYLTLALVIGWQLRRLLFRVLVTLALVTFPLAVAASRLYRGMHHPSDVIFGALNGLACLFIAATAFRTFPGKDPDQAA